MRVLPAIGRSQRAGLDNRHEHRREALTNISSRLSRKAQTFVQTAGSYGHSCASSHTILVMMSDELVPRVHSIERAVVVDDVG